MISIPTKCRRLVAGAGRPFGWPGATRVVSRGVMAAFGVAMLQPLAADDAAPGRLRVQETGLQQGWNAVYLAVEPLDVAPAKVFAGYPVTRVATWFEGPASNQFVTDPGVDLFKGQGWGVWYAPDQPEAFLKSLDAIHGNRAYLVYASRACQWKVSGRVEPAVVRWQADAFNLVGFGVRAIGGPTFGQFFAGSKAHAGEPIYRLVEGRWKKVLQPAGEVMRAGEAFWIFCRGASDYQGPLRVETGSRQGLLLGSGGMEVVLRNEAPHPVTPTMEHVAADGPPLPLSVLVRAYGNVAKPVTPVAVPMPAAAWQQPLPALESGAALSIPFECRRAEMVRVRQGSLLRIVTDMGTETWLPVSGIRDDLGD